MPCTVEPAKIANLVGAEHGVSFRAGAGVFQLLRAGREFTAPHPCHATLTEATTIHMSNGAKMRNPRPARFTPTRFSLAAALVSLFLLAASMAANAQLASPISAAPTGNISPGEIVWADLVTTDVESAVSFYTQVFGWQAHASDDPGYVELASNDQFMAAVARYEDNDIAAGNARWLVSISVADVDHAASGIERQGGSILQAPEDLPDRGRFAVVADSQGAVFMLLRATGGDPFEGEAIIGSWGWAELWTQDIRKAAEFYGETIGYRAVHNPDNRSEQPVIFIMDKRPRAIAVKIPWEDVDPNWIPYVPVADAGEILRRAVDAGGSIMLTSDDVGDDNGSFAAIIADPTGGVFGIQQAGGAR